MITPHCFCSAANSCDFHGDFNRIQIHAIPVHVFPERKNPESIPVVSILDIFIDLSVNFTQLVHHGN